MRDGITRRRVIGSVPLALIGVTFRAAPIMARQPTPGATPWAPEIDPAAFSTTIDNPYMPLAPGTVYTYEGTSAGESQRDVVTVTGVTRAVMGVICVVVHDQVFAGDTLLEDTFDWYAQHTDGTVWYFGEDSTAYEDGRASTEGSWEAGVEGAQPGIAMEAKPVVGDAYRQEYFPGVAEDMAEVLQLGGSVTVPYGTFDDMLVTREWTPLEPDVVEEKTYAPGIGLVLAESVQGEQERFELVDIQAGATPAAATPA